MLILDLKLTLFVLLAAVCAAGVLAWLVVGRLFATRRAGAIRPEREEELLALLDRAPFGLLALEGDRLRYGNRSARQLLYLPGDAAALPDAEWRELLESDRAAARSGEAGGRYRSVTFASGRTARWWVTAWGALDFVFLLDVTGQRRTEQAARTLLNDLGHELRTPIATLLTHLEILGLDDVGEGLRRQSLALSRSEAQRMARLVNDMLELGRLEIAAELPRRPLDLLALVDEVVLQLTPRAAEREMAIEVEADAPLPLVSGNADRLRQVFLNLLDNALKYARPGDHVAVTLRRAPRGVACAVCDTGPGIPAEHLPYVTQRFYRADSQASPGSGLGLALVAEILRRHESQLELESPAPDEMGTCARFVLPLPGEEEA